MTERIVVVENILNANDRLAEQNRQRLDRAGVFAINIMASPGAGKTSLVEATVRALASQVRLAAVDGDIATSLDADRAAAAGAVAVQVNTGGECHLDAVMLHNALNQLNLASFDLLIVENVGNLVCPISFKLGVHRNVLVASIPEGDDKPYKYPGAYQGVDVLVLNKIDLLPYVPFRMDFFIAGVKALNPGIRIIPMSCLSGEGVQDWIDWLMAEAASIQVR